MTELPDDPQDRHVHSTFSDGQSSIAENIEAAEKIGLATLCLVDHVRVDTTWVPDFVSTVQSAPHSDQLRIMYGVEAKLLDSSGRLDMPPDLPELGRVLIADHQFPGTDGPIHPREVRRRLDDGEMTSAQVIDILVLSTARAMLKVDRPQLAHLFSLLPKMGLDECQVEEDHLRLLAATAIATGAIVEVNEKWACPQGRVLAAFVASRVRVVTSTDSHHARDVGAYRRVPVLLEDAARERWPA
jgi:putative hydrolase